MSPAENAELLTALDSTVRDGSLPRTTELLEKDGMSAAGLRHDAVATKASTELLELLTSHDYDPNRPGLQNTGEQGRRLIDYSKVLGNDEVIKWLVDRSVSLDHGQEEYDVVPMPQPLLEVAAQHASLQTFKLLHEKGAKVGRRTLHCAVQFAAAIKADPAMSPNAEWAGFDPSKKFGRERRRMSEMLPFLVDELGLDVNAIDIEREREPPGHYGTPLCYAVYEKGVAVVKWLLSKGANPQDDAAESRTNAVNLAKALQADKCLEVMEEWQRARSAQDAP